jgi:hypothetical protein
VRRSQGRTRSVHSCCVGCVIEPRNALVAGGGDCPNGRTPHVQYRYARYCRPAGVEELREAAMDIALSLGQWPHQTSDKRRDRAETARRPASEADEAITIGADGQRN